MIELLNTMLPSGKGVLLVYSIFSDESVDLGGNVLTVAGYLIGSKQLPKLTAAWEHALGSDLGYLHMCDGHARSHPEVFSRLSELFKYEHFMQGFSVSMNLKESAPIFKQQLAKMDTDKTQSAAYWFGSPETFCAVQLAYLANAWMDIYNPSESDIAYVHELGGSSCGEMSNYGKWLRKVRDEKIEPFASAYRKLRFYSYNTVDGKRRDGGALQAADFLAWTCTCALVNGRFPEYCSRAYTGIESRNLFLSPGDVQSTIEATVAETHFSGLFKRATVLSP